MSTNNGPPEPDSNLNTNPDNVVETPEVLNTFVNTNTEDPGKGAQTASLGTGPIVTNGVGPIFESPASTATHSSKASSPTNNAENVPSISTSTASSRPASNGLSTGAKAGIAVGAVLGVALIGLLIFFLLRNRRKKRQTPLLSEEGKNLGVEPSTMSNDPYSDSPIHNNNWVAPVPVVAAAPAAVSHDHSPVERSAHTHNDTAVGGVAAAGRQSLQESRGVASHEPVYSGSQHSASALAVAPTTTSKTHEEHEQWDEDERRLEAEIAEIDRIRQEREERAALR